MKLFIFFLLVFISLDSFSKDPLEGRFFEGCVTEENFSLDYGLIYFDTGVEMETSIFRVSKKGPCKGPPIFALGRIWKYEVHGNELVTTLTKSRVLLLSKRYVSYFNENKFCEKDNWIVNEVVECTGKDIFGLEEREGYRTVHQFKVTPDYLEATNTDGEVKRFKSKSY
jgi:hypothetical protein